MQRKAVTIPDTKHKIYAELGREAANRVVEFARAHTDGSWGAAGVIGATVEALVARLIAHSIMAVRDEAE